MRWLVFPGLVILLFVAIPGLRSDDRVLQALSWLAVTALVVEGALLAWKVARVWRERRRGSRGVETQ